MDFSAIVEQTAKAAENNIPKEPCDYYGKDGLLRCGKCGTPKEHKTPPEFGSITVRCLCECEAKKREELKRKLARQNRQERLRNEAFNNQMMLENTFTADDGANPVLMTAARNYAEKFDIFKKMHKGLLFYGSVGTGKSFAAACIVNHLIEEGIPARFTNFSEIEAERREDEDAIKDLGRFDLLVLDDFAAERDTSYMREIVFAVIDARIQSGKPMVITTNLTAEELKKASDPERAKVYSRLLGACEPIEVKGDDRRRGQLRKDHKNIKELLGI